MIVEARTQRTNIDKDHARVDVFNPRFKSRPLISIDIENEEKRVLFFTKWHDLPNKCITVNRSKLDKELVGKTHLVRGALYRCGDECDCCKDDNIVYIYMPEQLIK